MDGAADLKGSLSLPNLVECSESIP